MLLGTWDISHTAAQRDAVCFSVSLVFTLT